MKHHTKLIAIISLWLCGLPLGWAQINPASEHWVATWATSQDIAPTVPDRPVIPPGVARPNFSGQRRPRNDVPVTVEDQTIRMVVHTSIGGRKVRIRLSNAFGKEAVTFGAVHVALRKKESQIVEGSDRTLTFGGKGTVVIRPGVVLTSDPVELNIKPMADLAVSLYLPKSSGPPTNHTVGLHAAYISKGDATASESMSESSTTYAYLWLSGVDVSASRNAFAVVALGDSITDGYATTRDADMAWPALLAKKLAGSKSTAQISVLNQGISGNQVLRDGAGVSALARFDRDVLDQSGARWLIILEGINDINLHGQVVGPEALTASDLIFGYRQIIERAHTHGIKVVGATMTPDEAVFLWTPVGEATRQSVNQWIRTSKDFDAVVDFDAAIRDPTHQARLKPEFDSGDKIHPNDAGNKAMADAFDLKIFK